MCSHVWMMELDVRARLFYAASIRANLGLLVSM